MKLTIKKTCQTSNISLVDFLASHLPQISKVKIKQSISAGGAWISSSSQGKLKRIKKVKSLLASNQFITFYYDDQIEKTQAELFPKVTLVKDFKNFGIWYKPQFLPSQNTPYSDSFSFLSMVEKKRNKKSYLVHRLDALAEGLLIVAYTPAAQTEISQKMNADQIKKKYLVLAEKLSLPYQQKMDKEGFVKIDLPLDQKAATTIIRKVNKSTLELLNKKYPQRKFNTELLLECEMIGGKYHQIRRHLQSIGSPLIDDPLYQAKQKIEPNQTQSFSFFLWCFDINFEEN